MGLKALTGSVSAAKERWPTVDLLRAEGLPAVLPHWYHGASYWAPPRVERDAAHTGVGTTDKWRVPMADGPRIDTRGLKEHQVRCLQMALPGCQGLCDLLLEGSLQTQQGESGNSKAGRSRTQHESIVTSGGKACASSLLVGHDCHPPQQHLAERCPQVSGHAW